MKIGVITIHKILNYGSALQAFALQTFLEKETGCRCEIIDYLFPNCYHIKERNYTLVEKLKRKFHILKDNCFHKHRKKRFEFFWNNYLHLSNLVYKTQNNLKSHPPEYDIYITGSDQVWNTNTLMGDEMFLLSFVRNKARKVAYASSFGADSVGAKYIDIFVRNFKEYDCIGVREKTALRLLDELGVKNYKCVVCDPTLLLESSDYERLIQHSEISIEYQYILVYCLSYAFDPYPAILSVLNDVYEKTKYRVVFINNTVRGFRGDYKLYNNIGPCEFVYLFKNASFVVTSSFHGTAFSVINKKPFISVSPEHNDTRIKDFLSFIGLEANLVYSNQTAVDIDVNNKKQTTFEKFFQYRAESIKFLVEAISNTKCLK